MWNKKKKKKTNNYLPNSHPKLKSIISKTKTKPQPI